jgi:hypothetical protein
MTAEEKKEAIDFIRRLDAAPFEITDWEARFVETILTKGLFTAKQTEVIDGLRAKYESQMP